ncbi:MAG: hypothetical protein DRJ01_05905 [Bacteroidetes bacterium]|nr:MAG: hypothetical protein DRJ01_05905 [Bacteroidota bacterium]
MKKVVMVSFDDWDVVFFDTKEDFFKKANEMNLVAVSENCRAFETETGKEISLELKIVEK